MLHFILIIFLLAMPSFAAETAGEWAKKNVASLVPLYKGLHENPELSFKEEKTATILAKEWRAAGFDVTTGVGGHGVVGLLKNGAGPTVMLRTDMDALPLAERTGLDYAAKGNVMHACGHDMHMASITGTARYLASHRETWAGTLILVGQPAEERGRGALAMLKDGLFKRFPKPDYAIAAHVDSGLETGRIGVRSGFMMASADSVDVIMKGKSGHGASPQFTIDPIVLGAQLVLDLQLLVSREKDPLEAAVVTVGAFNAGTKHNLIPDSAHLQLTVRSTSPQSRGRLIDGIRRRAAAVAAGAGAPPPEVKVGEETTPALINDAKLVDRIVPILKRELGADNVPYQAAVMTAEDFSRYGEAGVPIFMYRLGSVSPARMENYKKKNEDPPSVHSSLYYPDVTETLLTGVVAMVVTAQELLKSRVP